MTDHSPLDSTAVSLAPPWTRLTVVDEVASTNTAITGAPDGSVLVAEYQSAGRGRLERSWTSPPGAGLTFSVLLRPPVPAPRWGWLPLMAGVALCSAVPGSALKWPNDLLLGGRKAAGILATAVESAVVVGIGVNVSTEQADLPIAEATSLKLAGLPVDRAALLDAVLAGWGRWYREWVAAGGDAEVCGLAAAYRQRCATLGQRVQVTGADGAVGVVGLAGDVDSDGRLVVAGTPVAAGDVTHLRPAHG